MQKRGFKRAQAALEFLTTYGWAILILILVIVALANLNVFAPDTPNTCTVSAPFACTDVIVHSIDSSSPTFISNVTIKANNIRSLSVSTYRTISGTCSTAELITYPIQQRGFNRIGLTCVTGNLGDKEIGEIDLTYTLAGAGSPHTTTVYFTANKEG